MDASAASFDVSSPQTPTAVGLFAAVWGIGGVVALLAQAVMRLSPRAIEVLQSDLSVAQWVMLIGCIGFFAYTEGYKAFQKAFSPRVVARAVHLASRPVWWHVVLAPAFCMGFFHATRKRIIVSWILTAAIVLLILLVRLMPMPWRGFVDAGVVVALSWGLVAILWFAARAAFGHPPSKSPDLPESV